MRFLAIAVVVISLVACKKDSPEVAPPPPVHSPSEPVAPPPPPAAPDPLAPYTALAMSDAACEGPVCAQQALPFMKTDPAAAMPLFKKGCETRDGISCSMVAMGFEQGMGVTASPTTAAALYDRSCTMGYAKGCYNLALMLARAAGVPEDMPRAMTLLEKACDGGAWRACGSLGDLHLQQGDKAKALPVLEKGCKNEDPLSCETLPKAK